jgi:hypothetical protein
MHDPTQPISYVENQASSANANTLELGLTLISADREIAVINGLTLKKGDSIGNQRIEAIQPESVRLTGPSGNITLFLLDKPVKKAAEKNS